MVLTKGKKIAIGVSVAVAAAIVAIVLGVVYGRSSSSDRPEPAPTTSPEPHPTQGPLPPEAYLGQPNFVNTGTIIDTRWKTAGIVGGGWMEERGIGVVYASDDTAMVVTFLDLNNGYKVVENGYVNMQGSPSHNFVSLSLQAQSYLAMGVSANTDKAVLRTEYLSGRSTWVAGSAYTTQLSDTAAYLGGVYTPSSKLCGVYAAQSPDGGGYFNCYTVSNDGVFGPNNPNTVLYAVNGQVSNLYGMSGNSKSLFLFYRSLGVRNAVYRFDAENGTYTSENDSIYNAFGAVPATLTADTLVDLLDCSETVVAFADATNLHIMYDSTGAFRSPSRQEIPLATLDLVGPSRVQVSDELVVVHDDTKIVLVAPGPVNNPDTTPVWDAAGAQTIPLANTSTLQLPVSYARARGVGNLLVPQSSENGTWQQWQWILGSKQ